MEQILTLMCKLQLDEAQRKHIAETMQTFAQACQYVQDTLEPKLRNKGRMQTLVYRDIRTRFGLDADLNGARNIRTSGLQVSQARGP